MSVYDQSIKCADFQSINRIRSECAEKSPIQTITETTKFYYWFKIRWTNNPKPISSVSMEIIFWACLSPFHVLTYSYIFFFYFEFFLSSLLSVLPYFCAFLTSCWQFNPAIVLCFCFYNSIIDGNLLKHSSILSRTNQNPKKKTKLRQENSKMKINHLWMRNKNKTTTYQIKCTKQFAQGTWFGLISLDFDLHRFYLMNVCTQILE